MLNRSGFFLLVVTAASVMFALMVSLNSMFLFLGLISSFLFFNVTLSTMTNALRGLSVKGNDTFWRVFLMLAASVMLVLGIVL